MKAPFKMKAGSSPMKHFFGKHPSKKDGHVKADHKKKSKTKTSAGEAGRRAMIEGITEGFTNIAQQKMIKASRVPRTGGTKATKRKKSKLSDPAAR